MPYFPAIGYVHEAGDLKRVSTGMRRSTWKFTGGSVTPKIDEDANATGTYVLFTDADLSTPLEELYKLSDIAERDRADIVIGSRAIDRRYIERHQSRFREVGGIIFNRMVRMLLGLNLYDTQCGFKVFTSIEPDGSLRNRRFTVLDSIRRSCSLPPAVDS